MGQDAILRADCQSALRFLVGSTHYLVVPEFHQRRLPHYHATGCPMFLTWRLAGTLPANRCFGGTLTFGRAFVAMDRLLDEARTGPRHLAIPSVADLVADSIQHHATKLGHYDLHEYVVMANHVHVLLTPQVPVPKLTHSIKRYTSLEANRMLGLSGPFWQDESYDRLVRDEIEFVRIARYIWNNPVRAGLVGSPEEYPWSSAQK